MKEIRYILGGPQGGGLETSSQVLSWAFAREGYNVMSDREYFSNIKGRHSYVHATILSENDTPALAYPVNVLGAMDAETVFTHSYDVAEGGYMIYNRDESQVKVVSVASMEDEYKEILMKKFSESGISGTIESVADYLARERKINIIGLSYRELLGELQKSVNVIAAQASRYVSSILIGAVAALTGLNESSLDYALQRRFKSGEVYEHNLAFSKIVIKQVKGSISLDKPIMGGGKRLVVSGNDAVAMAKVVGGLRFQSYYPITPAADESFTLEEYERIGGGSDSIVVFQAEDEIGAIAAAIGSSLTGARSASATSGPGFDLMTEGLGWAGINEVPVVVTYYQRGGPSTGQPTRGGQSDLLSAVFASHGEYPRIVIASGDHEEAFWDTIDALNFADMFQTPVIHLVDKFLANTIASMPVPQVSNAKIGRGKLVATNLEHYKRFDYSSSISPRAFLGNYVMWYTGDEHNETGHITEESKNRVMMMKKRMSKINDIEAGIPESRRYSLYGEEKPDIVLLGWGFVKGSALRAIRDLKVEGIKASYLHIRSFIPFPKEIITKIFREYGADRIIDVEHNYEGQTGFLVAMNTGNMVKRRILKYTGRPIYSNELAAAVKRIISGSTEEVLDLGS
ncbi:MAG: 2-oxoacid:ferredoxin oxidoreductase subunit alpha [Conexivisphaerales archaeon]